MKLLKDELSVLFSDVLFYHTCIITCWLWWPSILLPCVPARRRKLRTAVTCVMSVVSYLYPDHQHLGVLAHGLAYLTATSIYHVFLILTVKNPDTRMAGLFPFLKARSFTLVRSGVGLFTAVLVGSAVAAMEQMLSTTSEVGFLAWWKTGVGIGTFVGLAVFWTFCKQLRVANKVLKCICAWVLVWFAVVVILCDHTKALDTAKYCLSVPTPYMSTYIVGVLGSLMLSTKTKSDSGAYERDVALTKIEIAV
eukprot:TRINITY_DN68134_c4_g1_i1.p1 TRINITY_DN68134_c4_g1~~TRINITY_DN68134_c4_g1_i1.p1  ORF type:complete len:251 (-),score=-11.00 TRINITY_DN68134_c4_g1_i1:912-1664(-)